MKIPEDKYLKKYYSYLKFERNLSDNSIEAYLADIQKLKSYIEPMEKNLVSVSKSEIEDFLCDLHELNIAPTSQARILSGVKSFYRFLLLDDFITCDPADLIESPKLGRKLPEVLSIEEINQICSTFDLSVAEQQRDRAIIEVLYSCGLRVSELSTLCLSQIYKKEGFIIVRGKGDKQRIVPIADSAITEIEHYMYFRNQMEPKREYDDFVFLNRLGTNLSRISIFNMVKKHCELAGIRKCVSPHTFRHSFATHLLEGGANLRAIQMMLGHQRITTTEIYTHIDRQLLREEILTYHPRNKVH